MNQSLFEETREDVFLMYEKFLKDFDVVWMIPGSDNEILFSFEEIHHGIVFDPAQEDRIKTDLLFYFLESMIHVLFQKGLNQSQIMQTLDPHPKAYQKFFFKKFTLRIVK